MWILHEINCLLFKSFYSLAKVYIKNGLNHFEQICVQRFVWIATRVDKMNHK